MRAALLADLTALPDVDLLATADPAFGVPTPAGVRVVPPVHEADDAFGALVEQVDAVWLIAPETDGALESLTAVVERAGRIVIGSGAAVIRRAADKAWLARRLAARGIPVPPSAPDTLPIVVKPRRGAGCTGVYLARSRTERIAANAVLRSAMNGRTPGPTQVAGVLEQAYIAGAAASVSLVCDGLRAIPLAVSAQHVRPGRPFTYHGGETPVRHRSAARAAARAVDACSALPGLRGYVGVDMVLTEDDAAVIELNPRLTTAYVGLRHALAGNVAALVLGAVAGELPASAPPVRERVRFSADGRVDPIGVMARS